MPDLEDVIELRGAESIGSAEIEDVWIAGMPFGKLVENAELRAKDVERELGERPEHIEEPATVWSVLEQLKTEIERVEQRLDEVDAGVPEQTQQKVDRLVELVEHAYQHGSGGSRGVAVETSEAKAVVGTTRKTTLGYMDDLGATFPWAETKDRGGSNQKQLRIETADHTLDELVEDVRREFGGVSG